MVGDKYYLQDTKTKIIIEVGQEVIDFLDMHDVESRGDDKYYQINAILYRFIKDE